MKHKGQQFPLNSRIQTARQRADPSYCDEFIALAMDEEQYEGGASEELSESGSQRELLIQGLRFLVLKTMCNRMSARDCLIWK